MVSGHIPKASSITAGAAAICLLVALIASPTAIGPIGVTGWFLVLLVGLASAWSLVFYLLARFATKSAPDSRAAWRRGLFVGGYITVLLALSSLQQLNVRDALLLGLLLGLIEFYLVLKR